MWRWLSWCKESRLKQCWGASLVATMWLLWLARNLRIFENKSYSEDEVIFLIKLRSLKWNAANNFVVENRRNVWDIHLKGVITHNVHLQNLQLGGHKVKLVGFSDGSLICHNGTRQTGIGGFLKDEGKMVKYIFSGPSMAIDVFHLELEAIIHLVESVNSSVWKENCCLFNSDNLEVVVEFILRVKAGLEPSFGELFEKVNSSVTKLNFHFIHISRIHNFGADEFAKKDFSLQYFQMEFPAVRWRMPTYGAMKVNMSSFYTENPLPNGNRSGIGVVIRNQMGIIERLYAGTFGFDDRRINELYAMFEGLIRACRDGYDIVELETDNVAAEWEWTNSMLHGFPHDHAYVVQQLNQRKADDNLNLVVRAVDTDSNELAMYLARHGVEKYHRMVIIEQPFGRIHEIWSRDMGLGSVEERFQVVYENDIVDGVVVNDAGDEEHGAVEEMEDA
ncbi:hypothetical protein POM88_012648 [Heracleum sosnowskyi]|uniref:RNase H type-1 domain-containing protein n=1 Tax=Heracleum sosnowskyi TaxID=360622 RepID=A0AAD8IWU9_9APIA|nr:hypothetical protein POM88_012648 [Heracleum sosnowskyi]